MDYDSNLSPLQLEGVEWLREGPKRMLADPPGFGKTRQLLAAVGGVPTLVVCPAAIRDAGVWEGEAKRTGWDGELHVISYHQLAKWKKVPRQLFDLGIEAAIFDESHHLKNRNVSWATPAKAVGRALDTVYEATGTPTPNVASELWGQLAVLRGNDMPAFWRWASGNIGDKEGWFHITTEFNRAGEVLTQYAINGHLQLCVDAGCVNAQMDPTYQGPGYQLLPVTSRDCEHWELFRKSEMEPWVMARPEGLLDLPDLVGEDTPLHTPMTAGQRKAYNELAKTYLAEVKDAKGDPLFLEAISDSQKFVNLWQLSTGLGAVNPEADDRDSGKLRLMAEMLEDRARPTLLACYFRNTGLILRNLCDRLGKSYVTFGAHDTKTQRRQAVDRFQAGDADVMIGSIAVVGEGLTLTAGDEVWMAERMWTPDKNKQVIRRLHRRGQTQTVNVRQFLTPDSVDEGQWEMLHQKIDRISQVDPAKLIRGKVELV